MQILIGVSFIFSVTRSTFADWKENAKAIDISGGEDHTLVLTENMLPWACGDNYWRQLGTGANDDRLTLVEVHGKYNVGYLKEIDDVDAGWKHSLALDVNDMVWAWGNNEQGELGDAQQSSPYYSATPVIVHDGEMNTGSGYLEYIIAISAGRSGQHSLAVDGDAYAYGWGYNKYGQCGNSESGDGERELTPVHVHRGEQQQDPTDANDYLKHIIAVSGRRRTRWRLSRLTWRIRITTGKSIRSGAIPGQPTMGTTQVDPASSAWATRRATAILRSAFCAASRMSTSRTKFISSTLLLSAPAGTI
jgi:hypothetical protein